MHGKYTTKYVQLSALVSRLKWGFIYWPVLAYKRLMCVFVECLGIALKCMTAHLPRCTSAH